MSIQVLIVEDDEMIRENLAAYLEDDGYQVLQAGDAESALEMLEDNQPDLAIVDIRLPGMDGNQWIIQANNQNKQIKFIIYTGYLEYKLPQNVRQVGLTEQDILTKPLSNMSQITTLIEQKLANE